jgi:hypothetical protein
MSKDNRSTIETIEIILLTVLSDTMRKARKELSEYEIAGRSGPLCAVFGAFEHVMHNTAETLVFICSYPIAVSTTEVICVSENTRVFSFGMC